MVVQCSRWYINDQLIMADPKYAANKIKCPHLPFCRHVKTIQNNMSLSDYVTPGWVKFFSTLDSAVLNIIQPKQLQPTFKMSRHKEISRFSFTIADGKFGEFSSVLFFLPL